MSSNPTYRDLATGSVENSNPNQPLQVPAHPRRCLRTVRFGAAPTGALWVLSSLRRIVCGRSVLRRAPPQGRVKMKTSLVMGTFWLVLLIVGCNMNPAPAPAPTAGPAGPQGQSGQTGQTGQSGQQGDQGQSGQQGAPGQAGDQGQTGQTGQQGRQGQDAPCPAGEHRYTNPDSGKVSCVRD